MKQETYTCPKSGDAYIRVTDDLGDQIEFPHADLGGLLVTLSVADEQARELGK